MYLNILLVLLAIFSFELGHTAEVHHSQECIALFTEVAGSEPSLQWNMLSYALSSHYSVKDIDASRTRNALREFVQILDPMKFFLLKTEVDFIENIDQRALEDITNSVKTSQSPFGFTYLASKAAQRRDQFVQEFKTSSSFRSQILEMAIAKESLDLRKSEESHADSEADARVSFMKFLARNMRKNMQILKLDLKTDVDAIKLQKAFVLSIRDFRFYTNLYDGNYYYINMPFIIVKAYTKTLDAHSDFLLPYEAKADFAHMSGQFGGIGVSLSPDFKGISITSVAKDGSAAAAGIQAADVITHIKSAETLSSLAGQKQDGWINARNVAPWELSDLIRGEIGSKVFLRILRDGKSMTFAVTREVRRTSERNISSKLVSTPQGVVAHVTFNSFYFDGDVHLAQEIERLMENKNLAGIVLDLRDNGGGSLGTMEGILGLFIDKGPAYLSSTGDKSEYPKVEYLIPYKNPKTGVKGALWNGPLVVMLNGHSASASETLAGALQDYGRAIIVGHKQSFGKGTMQMPAHLDSMILKTTIGMFFSPAGRSPQFQGIKPDIVITSPLLTEGQIYERDLPYALQPTMIDGILHSAYPMMPGREKILSELNARSIQRQSLQPKPDAKALAQNSQSDLEANEAQNVLSDLISIEKANPKPK